MEAFFRRAREAQCVEPGGDPGRSPGGSDDEVRRERLLSAAVGSAEDPHAGDAIAVGAGCEPERVASIDQRQPRQVTHAATHVALDEGPTGEDRAGAHRCAGQLMAADHEPHLLERRAARRPGGDQLGAEARQQRVEAALPTRQEGVGVAVLRHRLAMLEAGWQGIAVHDGHPLVGLRERAGRQQPAHTRTDHDGVLTDLSHLCALLGSTSASRIGRRAAEIPDELLSSFCSAAVREGRPLPPAAARDACSASSCGARRTRAPARPLVRAARSPQTTTCARLGAG